MNKTYLADSAIDVAVIARIYKLCFPDPLDGESIRDMLSKETSFAFLGREAADTGAAGFIICRVVEEESELLWLGVRPKKQRQGWARILMSKAFKEAQVRGARTMVLEVAGNNISALHLYESLGFETVGYRPAYYGKSIGGGLDAKMMRAVL